MSNLEEEASKLGIPMKMVVDDGLRYSYCDAHEATLVSIEGKHAVYKGQCANQHKYEQRFLISEIQQGLHILGGELVIGDGKSFDGGELEEY